LSDRDRANIPTSLSPLQFQKQIRLQEARSRLLLSSQDVAAIGFAVGYESPSQFSRVSLGDCITDGEHEPVGDGVDAPDGIDVPR
jgi:hypothetical protein